MDPLIAYMPQDRRQVVARDAMLPERATGAALFADISGFTPLTEALAAAFGPRRGAEQLTLHLNRVYDVLIGEVERYGGTVLSFAGDAMICWFDQTGGAAPERAVSCAVALQQAMTLFHAIMLPNATTVALALKVTIACGTARRFVVGNPAIQLIDTLAGATVARTATAEHLAERGDILLDRPAAEVLASLVQVLAWRTDPQTGEQFAVIAPHLIDAARYALYAAASEADAVSLTAEQIRPWLPSAVYERLQAGHGDLLTEFRPAVALFLRFSGWDDDRPDTGVRLDRFIQSVQALLMRYEGTLLQLNIGDKGSYVYAAFGAPLAHEDDPQRAVKAALALRRMAQESEPPMPVQVGLSRGTMRAGAYGGTTRRTYGIIGDDVNLAARLMQTAAPGEILASGRVQQALIGGSGAHRSEGFVLEPRLPVSVKGKTEPQAVFAVVGMQQRRVIRLQEPTYALPMVGRAAELQQISENMAQVTQGRGRIIGIRAEAGMGKSRLIAEAIRLGRRHDLTGYGGACQSDGVNTSYLVWRPIFYALFDLDPAAPLRKQVRTLEGALRDLAPERVESLPLLEAVLDLPLPENEFTLALAPQFRKSALEALLIDCLQATAREEGGLLLVLEDLHWLDPASYELLELVARDSANLPILIIMAYRPLGETESSLRTIENLPNFTAISLTDLDDTEMEQVIRAKLTQLFPERSEAAPPALIEQIRLRAQGNPFYLEELLNYIRDRGIDPWSLKDLSAPELPVSLQSLILSRIDQLSARQQLTLKVASVIGRVFRFEHLQGYYPDLGRSDDLKLELETLNRLDLTPLETTEPELVYLFKHIVTREVAYESLAYATRAILHEQYAHYLEVQAGEETDRFVNLLAYHYDQTENLAKRRLYLSLAGNVAARRYANIEALDYLNRALAITADAAAQFELLMARIKIHHRRGDREAQRQDLDALYGLVTLLENDACRAEEALQEAIYAEAISDYPVCINAAEQAVAMGEAAGLLRLVCEARLYWAGALQRQGEYEAARRQVEFGLELARRIGDREKEAQALQTAGVVAAYQNRTTDAQTAFEESLSLARALADRWLESRTLNSLGILANEQSDFETARDCYEQSLRLAREVGDRYGEATKLMNLGSLAGGEGDYHTARHYSEQALRLSREIGDRQGECLILGNLGGIAMILGEYALALEYYRQTVELSRKIGARELEAWALWGVGNVALNAGGIAEADQAYREAVTVQQELDAPVFLMEIRAGAARVALVRGDAAAAQGYVEEILRFLEEYDLEGAEEPFWVYLTCYQVLYANNDHQRAGSILNAGYNLLQERAAHIHSDVSRRRFLEQRPYHRALVEAWNAAQASPP